MVCFMSSLEFFSSVLCFFFSLLRSCDFLLLLSFFGVCVFRLEGPGVGLGGHEQFPRGAAAATTERVLRARSVPPVRHAHRTGAQPHGQGGCTGGGGGDSLTCTRTRTRTRIYPCSCPHPLHTRTAPAPLPIPVSIPVPIPYHTDNRTRTRTCTCTRTCTRTLTRTRSGSGSGYGGGSGGVGRVFFFVCSCVRACMFFSPWR